MEVDNFPPGRKNPCAWFLYGKSREDTTTQISDVPVDAANVPEDFLQSAREYIGIEDSLKTLAGLSKTNGPFDGVLGFSQGAVMAHILVALVLHYRGSGSAEMSVASDGTHPFRNLLASWVLSLRFACFCGGFPSRWSPHDTHLASLVSSASSSAPHDLPSLHFIATTDEYVPPQYQEELASVFHNSVVHKHDKGHTIPQRAADVDAFASFFSAF